MANRFSITLLFSCGAHHFTKGIILAAIIDDKDFKLSQTLEGLAYLFDQGANIARLIFSGDHNRDQFNAPQLYDKKYGTT